MLSLVRSAMEGNGTIELSGSKGVNKWRQIELDWIAPISLAEFRARKC